MIRVYMRLTEYLNANDFEFIDRVNYSTNEKVSRTVLFKRLKGRNVCSGKVTYFKEGTCSYSLKNSELGCKKNNESTATRTSLERLDARMLTVFG